jgi:hypothetical protein
VSAFVTAGAGFLLAVLWFDLMFDVQVIGHDGELPATVLASIAGYYARVTTAARPMNRLIATVMLAMLAAIVVGLARDEDPAWAWWASLALALGPIGLAGAHTVPSAVRLGARIDDAAGQSALARAVLRDHLCCLAAIAALLAVQLAAA